LSGGGARSGPSAFLFKWDLPAAMLEFRPEFMFLSAMRRRWKSILITLLVLTAVGWWGVPWLVPLPEALLKPPPASTLYLARDGTPLRHLLNEDGTRSAPPVAYAEIPTTLVHAVLAAEDKRFFSHGGVDPLAIARAAWDNVQQRNASSPVPRRFISSSSKTPRRAPANARWGQDHRSTASTPPRDVVEPRGRARGLR
jgi:hypothetical protein